MSNYDLDRIGDHEFEHLVQVLLKKVIGEGTTTFGDGPDGGREATFDGEADYPSSAERWRGHWIFQAKYHNVRLIGAEKARNGILQDLKKELRKLKARGKPCDNYILATNVPLSSVAEIGTHDQILKSILPEFKDIEHVHVWGHDDISRFLDEYPEIRQTYLHLVSPGDLIASLIDEQTHRKDSITEAVKLYVATSFQREQYAQLEQAGGIGEKSMRLPRVFIDLNVTLRSRRDFGWVRDGRAWLGLHRSRTVPSEQATASEILIAADTRKSVLIGGPGQGKSTLGQFFAQIHRAYILGKVSELNGLSKNMQPLKIRIPFRIILKDYAQWIVDTAEPHTLEEFISVQIKERAARTLSTAQVHDILKHNPTLVILDGLDEVSDTRLRSKMLKLISDFLTRTEDVLKADVQIIATSRPTGYSDQFDPSRFLHLNLAQLNGEKVIEYTQKWSKAKELETSTRDHLISSIKHCMNDRNFSALMNTPLQVTIFILIILSGGTPPRQREELFNEYLEVIYKRERAKSKTIIQTEKTQLFGLHQYLGYLLHSRAAESSETRSRMSEKEFKKEVLAYLKENDPFSGPAKLQRLATQILKEARDRLVLIVEFEDGYFGFELRSIQEFFAASWLTDQAADNEQRFKRFQAIALSPHWHNVVLFFAGRVGRCFRGEAASILEVCRDLDRKKPDSFLKRGASLALEIAIDRSFGSQRILQRSAIELALALLECDLPRENRQKLASTLNELPEEDKQDHLRNFLIDKLKTVAMPESLNACELMHIIFENKTDIQAFISRVHKTNVISETRLFQKALEFELAANFIKTEFSQFFQGLSSDDAVQNLCPCFVERTEYSIDVLQALDASEELTIAIFMQAVVHGRSSPAHLINGADVDQTYFDEVLRAWRFALIIKSDNEVSIEYFRRPLFRKRMLGRRTRERNLPVDLAIRIASDPGRGIVVRVSALALLLHVHSSARRLAKIENVFKKFSDTINLEEREIAKELLFLLSSGPLEVLQDKQIIQSLNPRPHKIRQVGYWFIGRTSILDPLDSEYGLGIIKSFMRPKISLQEFNLRKILIRQNVVANPFNPEELPFTFVSRTIQTCTSMLETGVQSDWQVWQTLYRLSGIPWASRRTKTHRSLDKLIKTLESFCDTTSDMIERIDPWVIVALLARVAELEDPDQDIVCKFLALLKAVPDKHLAAHINVRLERRFFINYESRNVQRLFETAENSDNIDGFLIWLAFVDAYAFGDRHGADGSTYSRRTLLNFNSQQIEKRFDQASGIVRLGLILLLSHGETPTLKKTMNLLDLAKSNPEPLDKKWASYLALAVEHLGAGQANTLLEYMFLNRREYPKAIKYEIFELYETAANSRSQDIESLEVDLGLPFNDVQLQSDVQPTP